MNGITFRIIENAGEFYEDFIDDFIRDYNKYEIPTKELCKKYSINYGQFLQIRKEAVKRGEIKENDYYSMHEPRFYYYNTNRERWVVSRNKKGKTIWYTSFPYEKQAQVCVEELKKCNWDKTNIKEIRRKIMEMEI